jgi:prephenate dehydratase
MDKNKSLTEMEIVAYLGPVGTYCEEAVVKYKGKQIDMQIDKQPFSSIREVVKAVAEGIVNKGILPLENSIEGTVNTTIDLLAHEYQLLIEAELIIPVEHYLLAAAKTKLSDIKTVVSHPQALSQCERFLFSRLPNARTISASSTAEAAQMVASGQVNWLNPDSGWAAIASSRAADVYGLTVLAEKISDLPSNQTRFIVISNKDTKPTGRDKTSLVMVLPHRPGSLLEALSVFAAAGINLTKIESRPSKRALGEYWFFVDIEGHHLDSRVNTVLNELKKQTIQCKLLGSYPAVEPINVGK